MTSAEALRAVMVAGLAERGELDEAWRSAFLAVPRHAFIPETVWRQDATVSGPDLVPVRREDGPDAWLTASYANAPVYTQVDDGKPVGEDGAGFEVTSSASMPAVVAQMLAALDAEPGMRVLEIGTGTGYNAALVAHRLGAENVVSVEIDPVVADAARGALDRAGYGAVIVITGDGADGHPDGGPYDRVLSTAAAATVPSLWAAQTRPGGRIVTPWATAYHPGLLGLTVGDDHVARGGIIGPASFMRLRAQRLPRYELHSIMDDAGPATDSTTELHPWPATSDPAAATAIGLRVPDCQKFYQATDETTGTLYLADQLSRSWAAFTLTAEGPYGVRQAGPRALWDEVEQAYCWWRNAGEPALDAWRFTVSPDGQRVELDPVRSQPVA